MCLQIFLSLLIYFPLRQFVHFFHLRVFFHHHLRHDGDKDEGILTPCCFCVFEACLWSIIISLVGKALGEHMDIWNGWTIGQLTSIHGIYLHDKANKCHGPMTIVLIINYYLVYDRLSNISVSIFLTY